VVLLGIESLPANNSTLQEKKKSLKQRTLFLFCAGFLRAMVDDPIANTTKAATSSKQAMQACKKLDC